MMGSDKLYQKFLARITKNLIQMPTLLITLLRNCVTSLEPTNAFIFAAQRVGNKQYTDQTRSKYENKEAFITRFHLKNSSKAGNFFAFFYSNFFIYSFANILVNQSVKKGRKTFHIRVKD